MSQPRLFLQFNIVIKRVVHEYKLRYYFKMQFYIHMVGWVFKMKGEF